MFDFRYHAVSLAAVFIALVIGIFVGVGLSSRGSVSNPERTRFNNEIAYRDSQIKRLRKTVTELGRQQSADDAFVKAAYPLVMANRLRGKRIVLVSIGPVDTAVKGDVLTALDDADASPAPRLRALKVPIDPLALDRILAGRPSLARYAGDDQLDDLGRALGQQLVLGGLTPLWTALADQLVEERAGALDRPVDGVVLLRSAAPQTGATARFLHGFYAGLQVAGTPVVGVEPMDASPSSIGIYRRSRLSSVDDVDKPAGRVALVLLLAGGPSGQYGVKDGADDVLPTPIEAVTTTAGG